MRTRTWTWSAAVAVCAVCAFYLVTIYLPLPHFVFVLASAFFVVAIGEAAVAAGARWSPRLALVAASILVPLGYVVGGSIGWATLPAAWTTPLWATIDATMNAARYGDAFENSAEHAVLYFLYSGILGALLSAAVAVGVTRVRTRHEMRRPIRGWSSHVVSALLCLLAVPTFFFNAVISFGICAGVAVLLIFAPSERRGAAV